MYSVILSTADPAQLTRDAARVTVPHLSASAAVQLARTWADRLADTPAVRVCLTDDTGLVLCTWVAARVVQRALDFPLALDGAHCNPVR